MVVSRAAAKKVKISLEYLVLDSKEIFKKMGQAKRTQELA